MWTRRFDSWEMMKIKPKWCILYIKRKINSWILSEHMILWLSPMNNLIINLIHQYWNDQFFFRVLDSKFFQPEFWKYLDFLFEFEKLLILLQAINLLEFFEILEKNVFGEDDLPGVQKVSRFYHEIRFPGPNEYRIDLGSGSNYRYSPIVHCFCILVQ